MGAEVPYLVRVLIATEDVVEVSALHAGDARQKAASLPGVVSVVRVENPAATDKQMD